MIKQIKNMKISTFSLSAILIGLVLGNFIYQSFTFHDYPEALERTIMQFTALFSVWVVSKLNMD